MFDTMKKEMYSHLTHGIIPFWKGLRDDEYGGYYGLLSYDLKLDKSAVKGCILNSRILWFFSNAYMLIKDRSLLEEAKHAYDFLKKYCVDNINGGVYWALQYDGIVDDDTKHTYNQAFAIYALSSYFDASKNTEALKQAFEIRRTIEEKCRDEKGYLEAFTRDFNPADNEKLSENGVEAGRTMNTLLHVFEAYTEYLRVIKENDVCLSYCGIPENEAESVSKDIRFILDIFKGKVYNPGLSRQEVFFDKDYHSLIDLHSYGHDIETSWLTDRGLDILGDTEYTESIRPITRNLAQNIYETAYVDHSLLNENEAGVDDTNRIWWVQAEAVLGFANAAKKSLALGNTREAEKFAAAAEDIWKYIKKNMIDQRTGLEWYSQVDKDGSPIKNLPIVEPWKCPYHNGRMCLILQSEQD